jgi:uncharacterized damage-inducible protein DinB
MSQTAPENFLSFSSLKLRQLASRIETCLASLDEAQVWLRSGEHANSIGNLLLHLSGNVRQWILHGVGGAPDQRHRDEEFAARGSISKALAWRELDATLEEALDVIDSLPPARLTQTIRPQNYQVTVLEAIYHVVEHFAQHTGQIIFLTKQIAEKDMAFYPHLSGTRQPPPPPEGQSKP